jgi:hypothetical protein
MSKISGNGESDAARTDLEMRSGDLDDRRRLNFFVVASYTESPKKVRRTCVVASYTSNPQIP